MDERRFGEVVCPEKTLSAQTTNRGNVDDHTGVGLQVCLPRCLAPEQRSAKVHLERLVVSRFVHLEGRPHVGIRRCVVHENVESTESFDRCGNTCLARLDVAGIRSKDLHIALHLCTRLAQRILLARGNHHLGASGRELGGDCLADAS